MKRLEVHDAIIATIFSGGQDLPLRTVVEMTIRLYENGYVIYLPECDVAPPPGSFAREVHTSKPANDFGQANATCDCAGVGNPPLYPDAPFHDWRER